MGIFQGFESRRRRIFWRFWIQITASPSVKSKISAKRVGVWLQTGLIGRWWLEIRARRLFGEDYVGRFWRWWLRNRACGLPETSWEKTVWKVFGGDGPGGDGQDVYVANPRWWVWRRACGLYWNNFPRLANRWNSVILFIKFLCFLQNPLKIEI